MGDALTLKLEREEIVKIAAALQFAANSAPKRSTSWELLKLRDRLMNEWNNEMIRRQTPGSQE
jgi:hypothetical protein